MTEGVDLTEEGMLTDPLSLDLFGVADVPASSCCGPDSDLALDDGRLSISASDLLG